MQSTSGVVSVKINERIEYKLLPCYCMTETKRRLHQWYLN